MSARKLVGFWDVEGVPVLEFGFTDSGGGFVAVDSDKARLFPGDSAYRNGAKVSEDRFAELFPEAVPRIAAALASPLLDANSEPPQQDMNPARFPNLSAELRELPPRPPLHPVWTPEALEKFQRNAALTAQAMVDNLNRKATEGEPPKQA